MPARTLSIAFAQTHTHAHTHNVNIHIHQHTVEEQQSLEADPFQMLPPCGSISVLLAKRVLWIWNKEMENLLTGTIVPGKYSICAFTEALCRTVHRPVTYKQWFD